MTYEILNSMTENGTLKKLYLAGILPMTAIMTRDACNLYMLQLKMGKTKTDAMLTVCLKLDRSESTVYTYLKRGGVI